MSDNFIIFLLISLVILVFSLRRTLLGRIRARYAARIDAPHIDYINKYELPPTVLPRVAKTFPDLTENDLALVGRGLKSDFRCCRRARGTMLSMPSKAVDEAWHEFLLHTRDYRSFCDRAFGRYLDHTPTEAMESPTNAQAGIRRVWRHACQDEQIDPRNPYRLPLLFGIDKTLAIPGGIVYALDCKKLLAAGGTVSSAGHIGCGSCSGGSGTGGDGCSGGGDGGCGGGCGGS